MNARTITASIALTAALFCSQRSVVHAERMTAEHVHALRAWAQAVTEHTAGNTDGAVVMVTKLPAEQVKLLRDGLPFFIPYLVGRGSPTDDGFTLEIAKIAEAVKGADWRLFLRRALVLHADTGIVRLTTPNMPPSPRVAGVRMLATTRDGQITGSTPGDWNWLVGRDLADAMMRAAKPQTEPFVSAWYHAASSTMLATRQYGELRSHLEKSAEVLPDDPIAIFDRACTSEANGLPAAQQVRAGATLVTMPNINPRAPGTTQNASTLVPDQNKANGDAEQLLRRALELDPKLIEARVRLARLLVARGKYDEALHEGEAAIALLKQISGEDKRVDFYAHLVTSRANRMLEHPTAAIPHAEAALALYPEAQSALLEQSSIALMLADTTGAIAPVDRLSAILNPSVKEADPWWQYQLGAGRNVVKIIEDLHASIR